MPARHVTIASLILLTALPLACRRPEATQPPETQPHALDETAAPELDDATAAEPSRPSPQTTQAPATAPASTQPDKSDEPNKLVVTVSSPEDPQPGWLVIEQLEKADTPATAVGIIAGPRKLIVETDNVKRIKILLAKAGLPINKSVVLRIDNQGIEITGRRGPVAVFERSLQGVWSGAKPK